MTSTRQTGPSTLSGETAPPCRRTRTRAPKALASTSEQARPHAIFLCSTCRREHAMLDR
ncbi:hypothetical protein ID866_10580 [Astraeus odoratus]|nr:hypothetical protein ID866_10580 [Astraeus odoratus]